MTRADKTVANRDNHYGDRLIGAAGRRKLDAAMDWLRAEYRHAPDAVCVEVADEIERLIKGRRTDGIT